MMKITTLILISLLFAVSAGAADLTFSWSPNDPSETVAGYKIHYGTASHSYTQVVDVGLPEPDANGNILGTVTGIPRGIKYYYAATAYNEDEESDYSNEVVHRIKWGKPSKPLKFNFWNWIFGN